MDEKTGLSREQTHLGNAIEAIEYDKARYDKNVKEFLADIQVLARIIKYTVDEVSDLEIEEIMDCIDRQNIEIGTMLVHPGRTNYGKVEGLQREDFLPNEGYITFDIRFSLTYHQKLIKLIINIEAQNNTDPKKLHYHLENRIIYYLSRLISSQKEVEFFHSAYDDIKKVYSIWICMDEEEESVNKISLSSEAVFGNAAEYPELDKMCAVVVSIRKNSDAKESKNTLIAMLEDLLRKEDARTKKNKLEQKYDMKMTTEIERRIQNMCNLSEVLVEQGIEQGLEQGMKHIVSNMLKKGMTVEQVAELCDIAAEEVKEVQKALL